jgi:hypothetical protein
MRVEGSFVVSAPRERVFAEITNPALMVAETVFLAALVLAAMAV